MTHSCPTRRSSDLVYAQTSTSDASVETLAPVTVQSSADASAEGLLPAYASGQVSRGGRTGLLGNLDTMDSPFNAMQYTNQLIKDQQAASVADILDRKSTRLNSSH